MPDDIPSKSEELLLAILYELQLLNRHNQESMELFRARAEECRRVEKIHFGARA